MEPSMDTFGNQFGPAANNSDFAKLPPSIQELIHEIMESNLSFKINPNLNKPQAGAATFDLQTGVMATLIALSAAAGAILNISLVFRILPLHCAIPFERALELNMCLGWFLFQVVCTPVLLTHDVLMIEWKFGDVMCKLIPWTTYTVMNAQSLTFCVSAVAFTLRMSGARVRNIMRVLDSKATQFCVAIGIWVATGLSSIPYVLEYGVVLYGIYKTKQCVNIESVMIPPNYQTLKLHYFIWLIVTPLIGTILTTITLYFMRCCAVTSVANYESVDSNENRPSNRVKPGYMRHVFLQLLLFGVTWIGFQIMTLFAAFSKEHAWLPRHTHIFNVTMTLAYMYPCLTVLLTMASHPYFKVRLRGRRGAKSLDASRRQDVAYLQEVEAKSPLQASRSHEVAYLQEVEANSEREHDDGDIIVYSQDELDGI